MAAELLFERRRPRHELEAEAVVDHGEAAGSEREALTVGAGDILAGRGMIEGLTGLGCEPFAEGFDLTAPERADQAVGEGPKQGRTSPLGRLRPVGTRTKRQVLTTEQP